MPAGRTAVVLIGASIGSLIGPGELPAATVANADGRGPALVLCDHAGAAVPRSLGDLGVPARYFSEHIAYDIGALGVARRLSARLDAPLVHSNYSRLVVDPNRFPDHPSSIPATSDGVPVPGNRDLDAARREARLAELFRPYHGAIRERLDGFEAQRVAPLIVSVHTFTPRMDGQHRPWHIGVLWNRDESTARRLLLELRRHPGVTVGDNQPYSAIEPLGFTCVTHCEARGLPHTLLEIRQDLVVDDAGQTRWAEIVATALRAVRPPFAERASAEG